MPPIINDDETEFPEETTAQASHQPGAAARFHGAPRGRGGPASPPAAPPPPPTSWSPPAPAAPPADVRVMTVEEAADMLSVHPADVLDLVKRGLLPAKRIGARVIITAAALAAYVAKADPRASLPRYQAGDLVVILDGAGKVEVVRFVHEAEDGRVVVQRRGLLGSYAEAVDASQVQPFTCRMPAERTH